MRSIVRHTALVGGLSLFAACADAPTQPDVAVDPARAGGQDGQRGAGTTLTAYKTATGFNETRTEYDWTLEKRLFEIMDEHMIPEASTTTTVLLPRTIKWFHYELVATRSEPTVTSSTGVRGEVCVTNGGDRPTEGLTILDVVQRRVGGSYEDYVSSPVDVSANPVLDPGESHCYPYEISLAGSPAGQYRNTARVTITNHSGWLGTPFGPAFNGGGVKADFTLPSTTSNVTVDAEAFVYEPMAANVPGSYEAGACAANWPLFFCTSPDPTDGRYHFTSSGAVETMVDIGNMYACDETFDFTNVALLTESGSGAEGEVRDVRTASAPLTITTPACEARNAKVRPVSFWQKGANWPPHQFWGKKHRLTEFAFFDTGKTWYEALQMSPRTAYERLAQQYIAATLNIVSGAPAPAAVIQARSDASHYFAAWPSERATVSDAQLDAWTSVLASYNASGK